MMYKEKLENWKKDHPTVNAWLNRLAPTTRYHYLRAAYEFFTWIQKQPGYEGAEPEELLELQDKCHGRERFKQLSMLQTWVQDKDVRLGTKIVRYSAIRSYYAHNHVPFPKDVTFRMRSNKPPVRSELTYEDLKKIILSCGVRYQGVYLIMFQGAMGSAEFEYFNTHGWPEVEPQLEEKKKRVKITLPGRKHSKHQYQYYTFIGHDAVEALRAYLKSRSPIKNGEPIFLNERGKPITRQALERYFTRHAIKVGVIERWTPACPECGAETRYSRSWRGNRQPTLYICNKCGKETDAREIEIPTDIRYGRHPHEMRDLFRSEWDLSQARSVCAEFFMGHDIDVNDYNKIMKLHPQWAENQYAMAEPYLNILSQNPRKVSKDRIEMLVEKRVQERMSSEHDRLERLERELEETKRLLKELVENRV